MFGFVYLITNKINGKKYVGLTQRTVDRRWKEHVNRAAGCNYWLHKALTKYGANNFTCEAIVSSLSKEALPELERMLIAEYRPEYNQTAGGEVTTGRKYSDAVKAIIRQKNTGKKRTPEQRAANSALKKKQFLDNPELKARAVERIIAARSKINEGKRIAAVRVAQLGKVWSNETRAKLSASCMGRRYSKEVIDRMRKTKQRPVQCVTTGEIFECAAEAAVKCKVGKRSVGRVHRGEYPFVKGLVFKYVENRPC
jgi:group I intron endonuclease